MPRKIIFAALFLALAAASVLVGAYDAPLASPEGAAVFFIAACRVSSASSSRG